MKRKNSNNDQSCGHLSLQKELESLTTVHGDTISSQTPNNGHSEALPQIGTPNQPKHRTVFKPRIYGSRERSFQASWFKRFL